MRIFRCKIRAHYEEHGYLVLDRHMPETVLATLRAEIARFEDEARTMTASNDRLDLEDSHTPEAPSTGIMAEMNVAIAKNKSV